MFSIVRNNEAPKRFIRVNLIRILVLDDATTLSRTHRSRLVANEISSSKQKTALSIPALVVNYLIEPVNTSNVNRTIANNTRSM